MKTIVGLDVGTNSVGWSVIHSEIERLIEKKRLVAAGSRIIPMDAGMLSDFDRGVTQSQTAERTKYRLARRIYERFLLRRERLHRILNILQFLPDSYSSQIDFYRRPGKFLSDQEPKLSWKVTANNSTEFIFQHSFVEMLAEIAQNQPQLLANGKKVPYDWTIYYLRKKALTYKIEKEELAWILLNFNQKRGYCQLRDENEQDKPNKLEEYYALRVIEVEATGEKRGKDIWYNIHLENGWIYPRASSIPLDWKGKTKEFIVTTDLEKDRTPKRSKDGNIKRSIHIPQAGDWSLLKKKTESDLDNSGKTVGSYIYDTLLQTPNQKIKGKLIRTIERRYYKQELKAILEKQMEFHPELKDRILYKACINELYPQNDAHRRNIANRDFVYLLMEDILFYQRPLKTKKSLISDCPYESHTYTDRNTGEIKQASIKCIAKSHPLFQEFRLWQFISNLRIYEREKKTDGKQLTDVDVTADFLKDEEAYENLFRWLNNQKEIDQKTLLKYPPFGLKKNITCYRWNYVEDKTYPCNETRALLLNGLKKAAISDDYLSREKEEAIWHILYSVADNEEIRKAFTRFAEKNGLKVEFVEIFRKLPPFEKEYGSYSAKAIKKLLPLMRIGSFWHVEAIDPETQNRITQFINHAILEQMPESVISRLTGCKDMTNFKGFPVWLACYVVYGRHSEAQVITKWNTPEDIDRYLKQFKQHSLRNPVVEQVILETLRVVRDIWKQVGRIDEIHIELGREMKKTNAERERISKQNIENENANYRIKRLLMEFLNPEFEIQNVRPYSPSQQEILRIYEEGVLNSMDEIPDDISEILKKFMERDIRKQPGKQDILRYKLWLEQKYRSPYTGEVIPLAKLFTPAYEIEHIIPQSRYFDDSFSNKVICESEINKLKNNMLGYEFIKNHSGQKVEISFGKPVTIFTTESYEAFVKDHYSRSYSKMKKLFMDEIPDDFIARQLNDSRYISKMIKSLLSNIVREKNEQGEYEPEAVSKHVISCTGAVTDRLKKDWGLNDVWNNIIYPRFERLNNLTGTTAFTTYSEHAQKYIPSIPLDIQKGFSKKRIDHRHHAMDAIVIACASRNHINYLNNESASKDAKLSRYDLQRLLCEKVKTDYAGNKAWMIRKPWDTFTEDVYRTLDGIIVSFKQNQRVINKTTNYYTHYNDKGKKMLHKQEKGTNWAIRKPMHKETVLGEVNIRRVKNVSLSLAISSPERIVDKSLKAHIRKMLQNGYDEKRIAKYFKENKDIWAEVNLTKISVYYFTNETKEPLVASRKPLDTSFTTDKIVNKVTDTGIQKILLRHLEKKQGDPELAFSPDGIDEMNRTIGELNDDKNHHPIYKLRVCETKGRKFKVGERGNKSSKFVEAAEGTNLFFAIYQTEEGKRVYETIPLNIVIERQKQGLSSIPEVDEQGNKLLFGLSPNDLVYVPEEGCHLGCDRNRIYKMVSSSGNQCFFIPYTVANPIVPTTELGANNKAERAWTNEMIKKSCYPIKVDRLGNIIRLGL